MTPGVPALASSRPTDLVGGRYELLEKLGEGAVGEVYRARHTGLDRQFALKLLHVDLALDPEALDRFQREATVLGRLRHPNVVDVTDFGVDDGPSGPRPFLVMELLEGEPLADLLCREGALPLARALPILRGIAGAVDAVHGSGIVHRDLKPSNVVFARGPGGETVVKVLDFGLAGFLEPLRPAAPLDPDNSKHAEETNFRVGTPLYTAPEFLGGDREADSASDLYTLGVIAYEMLLGRPPFTGTAREVLLGHLGGEPPAPEALGRTLPPGVWKALRLPLAKDPRARPATASELVGALENAVRVLERVRSAARFEAGRRKVLAGILALLGLAALALPRGVPPLERWLFDRWLTLVPSQTPGRQILLVTLDSEALGELRAADGLPVPLGAPAWGDELATRLDAALEAGARGVAIDLVLGQGWGASERFSDFLLTRGGKVALGVEWAGGRIYGREGMNELTTAALGERAADLFGYVDIEEEADGVVRRGRSAFLTADGGTFPSWAARATSLLGRDAAPSPLTFPLDTRIRWETYPELTWSGLAELLRQDPGRLRDHLLLVGTDQGDDMHRVPGRSGSPEPIRGVALQALAVDTLARGRPLREALPAPFLVGALALTGLSARFILTPRPAAAARATALLALALLVWAGLSLALFRGSGVMVPTSGPLALAALGAALALAARPLLPRVETETSS